MLFCNSNQSVEKGELDPSSKQLTGSSPGSPFGIADCDRASIGESLNPPRRSVRRVPGARASTLSVSDIWQTLFRHVFQFNGHLGNFLRALANGTSKPLKGAPTASLFPMPLPYPDVFSSACIDKQDSHFKKLINLQICVLDWLHLNQPFNPPYDICGNVELNVQQQQVVNRLWKLQEAWFLHEAVPARDMGRTAAKQEAFEDVLCSLSSQAKDLASSQSGYKKLSAVQRRSRQHFARGRVIGRVSKADVSGAQQIIASRVKMAGEPSFDPRPFLNDSTRELYDKPMDHVCMPSAQDEPPPKVHVHALFAEKMKLLKLLEDSNRLSFRSPQEVLEGYGNGLFCVPKDLQADRLILDARPANCLLEPPNKYILTMGASTTLLGIHLKDGEKLLVAGDDLSNFFYTFKVGEQRISRNFLEWKVPTSVVSHMSSFPSRLRGEKYVYPCLATLAMGDAAACEFAQTSHLSMGLHCGAFDPENLVTIHGRVPRTPFMAGIIIDDLIFLEKVAKSATQAPLTAARVPAMHSMYNNVGLKAHPSKGFKDSVVADFWGAHIDGEIGLIRANIPRSMSLCWITNRVASMGVATIALLEALAGGFVSLFSFRRRLMSLLDFIYQVQAGRDQRDIIRLPEPLIAELYMLCTLAPLAVSDLRADFVEELYAVDASDWGEAGVVAHIGKHLGSEIHRHSVMKSAWTKLLSPFKVYSKSKGSLAVNEELPNPEDVYTEHPLWETACRGLSFSLVYKRRAKRARHINLGELRAFLEIEKRVGFKSGDCRIPIATDSQVCLGAVTKGRSASPALNRELRCSLAYHLGLGVYSCSSYISSGKNPSDDPTRGKDIRPPDICLPDWWNEANSGNFSKMDSFLSECGVHPDQLNGFGNLGELCHPSSNLIDPQPRSKLQQHKRKVHAKLVNRAVERAKCSEVNESRARVVPWSQEVDAVLCSFPRELFILGKDTHWPPTVPGFIDLYSGHKGFAKAACRLGAPWVLTIDINDGPHCDLLNASLRDKIILLLPNGVAIHFSAAPICSSFSRAVTPAVRTKFEPLGVKVMTSAMKVKVAEGNSHASFLSILLLICLEKGIHYWVENPDTSFIWDHPGLASLPKSVRESHFRTDFCRYSAPWRKRTKFLTSGRLRMTNRMCLGNHSHIVLRGRSSKHKLSWTKVAEPYPRGLCSLLAWAACSDCGCVSRGIGLPAAIARSSHSRIGEASNPGPRRGRDTSGRSSLPLDQVQLVRPETSAMGLKFWTAFCDWINLTLGSEFLSSLYKSPHLLGATMAAYGKHLYETGVALYVLRQLVTHTQRTIPGSRLHLQPVWEVVSKWELVEPISHRRPVPLKLLEAMAAVAVTWKWYRFVVIIVLAYFGCCRTGEVLRAQRRHVVLPIDLALDTADGSIFLRIVDPKAKRRGLGKIQHAKIEDSLVCRFLSRYLGGVDLDEHIYSGAPSTFRRRWDLVLKALDVPAHLQITPGGLRPGGTVELYRRGKPIQDILWSLRLKNLETLQHYLQEVSTDITMVDLPSAAKSNVLSASSMYRFLLESAVS